MEYPKIEQLNSNTCTERYMKMKYYDFWKYLISNYNDELKWSERLYWFYNNITEYPKCPICGRVPGFVNFKKGYKTYCSAKCSNSCPDKREKTKTTNNIKYGGNAPASSKKIKEKAVHTNLLRYGVSNIQKLDSTKEQVRQTCLSKYGGQGNSSKILLDKYKSTSYEKYGTENPMQNDLVKENFKLTMLETYNVDHPSRLKSIRQKIQQSRRNTEMIKHTFIKGYTSNGDWICECPHPECEKCDKKLFVIPALIYEGRKRENTEICTNLLPVGIDTTKNNSLELFVQNILGKYNIEFQTNVRSVINPKELDILINDIAIECNGVYTHSVKYKYPNYHIDKTKECRCKRIRLIHIWEDWIKTKPKIVESIILNKLGLISNTIYARKTTLKVIDSKVCNEFLDNNHIQGRSAANIRLGLYSGDELVSVMTFGKPRVNMGTKDKKTQWELIRFCSKLNTRVVGGASKLLKYFIKTYHPISIESFSSNDISDGELYKKLGFVSDYKYNQSYWYIEPGTLKRYHRSSFSKQQIVKRGWKDKVDSSWTEKEVMKEHGYFCIYDSGQFKWILDLSKEKDLL